MKPHSNNKKGKKKLEEIEAWIFIYETHPFPTIYWEKPTEEELKNAKDYGEIIPVLITPLKTKKQKR